MKPSDILAASRAFIQATQGDVVPDNVIADRARICRQCPLKKRNTASGAVSQILAKIANENKVPNDIKDYSCSICGCSFMLLLPAKEPHKDSVEERRRREKGNKYCWMLKL